MELRSLTRHRPGDKTALRKKRCEYNATANIDVARADGRGRRQKCVLSATNDYVDAENVDSGCGCNCGREAAASAVAAEAAGLK